MKSLAFDSNKWKRLTVCNQISTYFLKKYIQTIHLQIIYAQPFNCVQANDWCSVKLLVLHGNTWNKLCVCKQMMSIKENIFTAI